MPLAVVPAVPDWSGQALKESVAAVDAVEVCDVDPITEPRPAVPRPVVPSPEVPRLVVPRPVAPSPGMPRLTAFSAELGDVVVEAPELDNDEEDEEVAAVPELFKELMIPDVVMPGFKELVTPVLPTDALFPEFEEFMIPELLTELHGIDVLVPPGAMGTPDTVELPPIVESSIPPPSNVGSVAEPALPVEHGAEFAVPEYGMAEFWELAEAVPKSVPSGDVDPMMPGKGALVCAALGPMPSAEIASIAAVRKDFIWMTVHAEVSGGRSRLATIDLLHAALARRFVRPNTDAPTSSLSARMADRPDIGSDSSDIGIRQRGAPAWRHRDRIVFRLRHAIGDCPRDAHKAAIASQPLAVD